MVMMVVSILIVIMVMMVVMFVIVIMVIMGVMVRVVIMVMMVVIASNGLYGDDGGYCQDGDDVCYCHMITMVVMVW